MEKYFKGLGITDLNEIKKILGLDYEVLIEHDFEQMKKIPDKAIILIVSARMALNW